jgi:hypothetical protein
MPGSPPSRMAAPGTSPEPRTRSRAAMPLGYGSLPSQVTLSSVCGLFRWDTEDFAGEALPGEPCRTATGWSVFHSPQEGHCPCHWKERAPQPEQTYISRVFAMTGFYVMSGPSTRPREKTYGSRPVGKKKDPGGRQPAESLISLLVRPERFELPTHRFVACCSIQLSYERIKQQSNLFPS